MTGALPTSLLASLLALAPPPGSRERAELEWQYRDQALRGGTIFGISLVGTGATFVTLPWAVFAAASARDTSGRNEGYAPAFTSMGGAALAGVGLVVTIGCGIALSRHRRLRASFVDGRVEAGAGGVMVRF